eukprot:CAMPEP_0117594942 /NCGR_PEP_ID=MMETSP0784-20121206/73487_1 /TAXON_ID=39447 /ORGANISM="" /LENGTH=287 /DNA_ID=CAMNT_0005397069 /DNA_START=41 /DNA_END=901 /DNA_ORIENTATION=+
MVQAPPVDGAAATAIVAAAEYEAEAGASPTLTHIESFVEAEPARATPPVAVAAKAGMAAKAKAMAPARRHSAVAEAVPAEAATIAVDAPCVESPAKADSDRTTPPATVATTAGQRGNAAIEFAVARTTPALATEAEAATVKTVALASEGGEGGDSIVEATSAQAIWPAAVAGSDGGEGGAIVVEATSSQAKWPVAAAASQGGEGGDAVEAGEDSGEDSADEGDQRRDRDDAAAARQRQDLDVLRRQQGLSLVAPTAMPSAQPQEQAPTAVAQTPAEEKTGDVDVGAI